MKNPLVSNQRPFVTIITATFNSESQIERCLRSVATQDYTDLEHVIIDGASTDQTLSIISKLKSIQGAVLSEPDAGIYSALNKGVINANGSIIGFLHSDDYFYSTTAVSDLVSTMVNDQSDGAYGDVRHVRQGQGDRSFRNWKSCVFEENLLFEGWMPPHPTLFLKRECYEKIGLFDESFTISADYHFILRLFMSGQFRFSYCPSLIMLMTTGGASNKSFGNMLRKTQEDFRALKVLSESVIIRVIIVIRKNLSKLRQFFY